MKLVQRTCLRCGKQFGSHGPGNRRCKRCERTTREINLKTIKMEKPERIEAEKMGLSWHRLWRRP